MSDFLYFGYQGKNQEILKPVIYESSSMTNYKLKCEKLGFLGICKFANEVFLRVHCTEQKNTRWQCILLNCKLVQMCNYHQDLLTDH